MDDPAYLAARVADEDPDEDEDPDDAPPPDVDEAELIAEADEIIAAQERVAAVRTRLGLTGALAACTAAGYGRRGPRMPGSAQSFPGVYASRSSGFASGKPLDTAPGCLVLGQFAEEAAGEDDRYPSASDDELAGVVAAWDRVEAYASSRTRAAFRSGLLNQRKAAIIASATALLDPAEARAAEAKVLDRARGADLARAARQETTSAKGRNTM
jgi:hypothetical protein